MEAQSWTYLRCTGQQFEIFAVQPREAAWHLSK
jgi:hypothetical protein